MDQRKSQSPGSPCVNSAGSTGVGAHHISSIAHLFLDEVVGPIAEPDIQSSKSFMVLSAGSSAVAAVAAAGLSMGSLGEDWHGRVILRENEAIRWSACSFLAKSTFQLLGPMGNGENVGKASDHGTAWLIQAGGGPAPGTDPNPGLNGSVRWFHAGSAADDTLLEMETVAGSRNWGNGLRGASDGLVWCLLEEEAASLTAAYKLGRLISLLHPQQVEILIFPDSWRDTGRPIWQRKLFSAATRSDQQQESSVARCRELADMVGDCQVNLMPDSIKESNGDTRSSGAALQLIASRMLSTT